MVCTSSCTSLDHILTYLFKKLSKAKHIGHSSTDNRPVLKVLDYHREVFEEVLYYHHGNIDNSMLLWLQMLSAIFNIIMYEECKNLWSMSRPLLGLIVVNEEVNCIICGVNVHINIVKHTYYSISSHSVKELLVYSYQTCNNLWLHPLKS